MSTPAATPSTLTELQAEQERLQRELPTGAYSLNEVAIILREITDDGRPKYWTVGRLIKAGKLRARNTGKHYRVPGSAILEYLEGFDEPLASAS
jgi:excisionase family DNA binding protein